ncbi:MAG: hypothetical protein ACPF9G_12790, partial [Paracoccaceae bacterium]
ATPRYSTPLVTLQLDPAQVHIDYSSEASPTWISMVVSGSVSFEALMLQNLMAQKWHMTGVQASWIGKVMAFLKVQRTKT